MPRSNEATDPKHNSNRSYLPYFESKWMNKISKKGLLESFYALQGCKFTMN